MKSYYYYLLIFLLASCAQNKSQENVAPEFVTNQADYQQYLETDYSTEIEALKKEIDSLENRLQEQPTAVGDLSRLSVRYNKLYDLNANVDDLNKAVRAKEEQVRYLAIKPWQAKQGLAQLYIKQHRFKKADSLMRSFATGNISKESQFIYFDIAMELGDYERALEMLDSFKNVRDYNYLIRAAKWNDYKGDLQATLSLMEQAKTLADQSGNTSLQLWSNSNIADYYGHDGQIGQSYQHYLNTLALDPGNYYALKGISWILYAYEDRPEEALEILTTLQNKHPLPDYHLAIAEIKAYQEDQNAVDSLESSFLEEVNQEKYGAMYNTYKIELLAEGTEAQREEALQLAAREVENRSTPETRDLLSYALLKNKNPEEALIHQQEYVIGKTFEPVAALHTYEILKANGMDQRAAKYREEVLDAAYELGPVITGEIKKGSN